MQRRLDYRMGEGILLLGHDLEADGSVTLYWQSQAPGKTSYTIFVHAIDASGQPFGHWGQATPSPLACMARPQASGCRCLTAPAPRAATRRCCKYEAWPGPVCVGARQASPDVGLMACILGAACRAQTGDRMRRGRQKEAEWVQTGRGKPRPYLFR
jgi:hypothetical protein